MTIVSALVGCSSADESTDGAAADLGAWCAAAAVLDQTFAGVEALGSAEIDRLTAAVDDAGAVAPDAIVADVAAVAGALSEAAELLAGSTTGALSANDAPPTLLVSSDENLRITEFNEANCSPSTMVTLGPSESVTPDQVIDVGPEDDARVSIADALVETFGIAEDDARCVADRIDFGSVDASGQLSAEVLAAVFDACDIEPPAAPAG